ncbi:hypothetical protein ABPG74_009398 [Tetrahymena malaccensis]
MYSSFMNIPLIQTNQGQQSLYKQIPISQKLLQKSIFLKQNKVNISAIINFQGAEPALNMLEGMQNSDKLQNICNTYTNQNFKIMKGYFNLRVLPLINLNLKNNIQNQQKVYLKFFPNSADLRKIENYVYQVKEPISFSQRFFME